MFVPLHSLRVHRILSVKFRTFSQYEAIVYETDLYIIAGKFLPAHLKLLPKNFTFNEKWHSPLLHVLCSAAVIVSLLGSLMAADQLLTSLQVSVRCWSYAAAEVLEAGGTLRLPLLTKVRRYTESQVAMH